MSRRLHKKTKAGCLGSKKRHRRVSLILHSHCSDGFLSVQRSLSVGEERGRYCWTQSLVHSTILNLAFTGTSPLDVLKNPGLGHFLLLPIAGPITGSLIALPKWQCLVTRLGKTTTLSSPILCLLRYGSFDYVMSL